MEVQMNSRTESCSVTISTSSLFPRFYAIIKNCHTSTFQFGVTICRAESLVDFGITPEEALAICDLSVGESYCGIDDGACQVTRIS